MQFLKNLFNKFKKPLPNTVSNTVSNTEKIRIKIKSIINTDKFHKFLHWILSDTKYGSINQSNDPRTKEVIQTVIDLYEEWINTGKKPSEDLWLKAKEAAYYAAVYTAAYAAYASASSAIAGFSTRAAEAAADAADAAGIPRSEVEKAQLDKLDKLINQDELYSWEDYETP